MFPEGSGGQDPVDSKQGQGTALNPQINSMDYSATSTTTNAPVESSVGSTGTPSPYTYQELPGGVMCPTCSGAGRIPRGQEDDLVALIPYRDDRLRPRRTGLYVFLSILLCGAIAGILCAFLLTKPVHMAIQNITTTGVYVNTSLPKLIMNLEITYNISNANFPSIYLKNITVIGLQSFNQSPVVSNTSGLDVRVYGRTKTQTFTVNVTAVFVDEIIPTYCSKPWSKLIPVEFSSSLQYQLMTQVSSISTLEYKQVLCNQGKLPWTSQQGVNPQQRISLPAG